MAGGKGKSSGGKSSGGKTSGADGAKKQQSHSARAGLQVSKHLHFSPWCLFVVVAHHNIELWSIRRVISAPSNQAHDTTAIPSKRSTVDDTPRV